MRVPQLEKAFLLSAGEADAYGDASLVVGFLGEVDHALDLYQRLYQAIATGCLTQVGAANPALEEGAQLKGKDAVRGAEHDFLSGPAELTWALDFACP